MKKTDLIINQNPKSVFSESIKSIRTNLAFTILDKNLRILLSTSPEAGDGKSFVTANLAVAYTQANKRVLIIDCDLRRGRQHQIFGVMNLTSGGYSNLILNFKDDSDFDKYIVKTDCEGIDLLPTGPTPPNPVELLSSDNNKKILARLKKKYDIILLDCPPVLGLSDSLIMTQYSDANLIVVSAKKTKFENLERTKKQLEHAGAKIAGVVLNKAPVSKSGYYGYYYNDYYSEPSKNKKK